MYAASEYTFYNVLGVPVEEFVLSTAPRKDATLKGAKFKITETNCPQGSTMFRIRDGISNALASDGMVLVSNSYTSEKPIAYNSDYEDICKAMNLTGQPTGAYTGFEIGGIWYPNGY